MLISAYITREILRPFLLISGVLMVLMVSYSTLVLLSDESSSLISGELLSILIFSKSIAAFEVFLPLSLYITLLMGLGKLYSEQEINALHAAGLSVFGLVKALFPLIVTITIVTAIVAIFGRPWAYDLRYTAKHEAQHAYDFDRLEEGYFYENEDSGQVYFAKSIDDKNAVKNNIFVYKPGENFVQVIYAQRGHQIEGEKNKTPILVFNEGSAYRLQDDDIDTNVKFNQFTVIPEQEEILPMSFKRKAASIGYLSSSKVSEEIAEFQWRCISAFKAFLLAIIAIYLAKTSPRDGRYGKLIFGIIFFFVVHAFSLVLRTWVEHRVIPAFPGMWSLIIALVAMTFVLSKRTS